MRIGDYWLHSRDYYSGTGIVTVKGGRGWERNPIFGYPENLLFFKRKLCLVNK